MKRRVVVTGAGLVTALGCEVHLAGAGAAWALAATIRRALAAA